MASDHTPRPVLTLRNVLLPKTGRILSAFTPRMFRILPSIFLGAAGAGIVILAWWLISLGVDPLRLPSPWAVFAAIPENWLDIPSLQYVALQSGGLADALSYTVSSVLLTVAIGSVAGVLVGIALPLFSTIRLVVSPALIVLGSTPVLILMPFLVEWFGNGGLVRSGIVAIFTFVVLRARGVPRREREAVAAHYLKLIELERFARARPRQLSGV
jgi:ABC-type nitrate/sulfonate/bicarbonate transport system permease component